ncbi:MAG: hypothetical protein OEM62_13090, partial [Acidobacteriota bacterium]|nr:hypothetical protein [Acidobacteriota bacterium]
EYTWAPTDMFSVPPDDNLKVAVTYAPTDEGTDEGCLEIVSNDLDESPAVLEVVGTGVESLSEVVDFDIYDFKVKRKIRLGSTQKATPALWVKNTGQLDDSRPAIVMGMQNGVVVYDEELMVSDRGGNQGKTKYRFPSFVPADPGEILWVAVIDDDDEDIDESMAVTQVVGPPTASAGFDLDAAKLKATKRVALSEPQPIRLRAWVMNSGSVDGVGAMTLSGMQAGVEVYREMLSDVSDIPGDGAATRYDFTSFTPIDEGDILWTLSIADGDIDDDVMSAVTRVGP